MRRTSLFVHENCEVAESSLLDYVYLNYVCIYSIHVYINIYGDVNT